ncbi:MAG TPA: aminoglycoside phosphotransferase family protein [Candidatus Angelobacter sp.]|nr:aminoglycoside phosphotransferase family protein [Candidatus Angelobacter sp.]
MSDTIERRRLHVELDRFAIENLVRPVDSRSQVTSATLLSTGKLNTNYKVELADRKEPLVLRIYTHDSLACERDAALYQRLGNKVPMAPVLYHAASGPGLEHPYAVFAWVDGVLLSEVLERGCSSDIASVAQAAGVALAAINQFRFDSAGFLGAKLEYTQTSQNATALFRDYLRDVEHKGLAVKRLGPGEFHRILRFIDDHLGCLAVTESWYSFVHGDYTGTNVIVWKEEMGWRVSAILDWEFVTVGTSIFDVGVFLRNEDKLPPDFRGCFTRAFADAGGYLPPGWRRASKLLDLVNQFAFLDADGEYPNTFADASARIYSTIAHWSEFND